MISLGIIIPMVATATAMLALMLPVLQKSEVYAKCDRTQEGRR